MLNLPKTAEKLERLIIEKESQIALPDDDRERGTNHLKWMCRQVYNGQVTGYKAHQWLGFVQGAIVASGAVELTEIIELSEVGNER